MTSVLAWCRHLRPFGVVAVGNTLLSRWVALPRAVPYEFATVPHTIRLFGDSTRRSPNAYVDNRFRDCLISCSPTSSMSWPTRSRRSLHVSQTVTAKPATITASGQNQLLTSIS
jgi:hypothetical protein